MILKIDMSGTTPIYEQLRNEIVKGIGRGELSDGESLPTVRRLAADLGVNNMTVSKAYQLLKAEGFIETDRRRGAIVRLPAREEHGQEREGREASGREKPGQRRTGRRDSDVYEKAFLEKMEDDLELLSAEAKIRGLKKEEFVQMCEEAFAGMEG